MNMRQHKQRVDARWSRIMRWSRGLRWLDGWFTTSPEEIARQRAAMDALWEEIMPKMAVRQLAEPEFLLGDIGRDRPVESTAPEFVCVKVNGGEVVATFKSREEALALVIKHSRQRKAKLQVMCEDELIVFADEELMA